MRRESQAGTSDSTKSPFGLVRFLIKNLAHAGGRALRFAQWQALWYVQLRKTIFDFEKRLFNLKAPFNPFVAPNVPLLLKEIRAGSEMPRRMFGVKRLSNPMEIIRRQIYWDNKPCGCKVFCRRQEAHKTY